MKNAFYLILNALFVLKIFKVNRSAYRAKIERNISMKNFSKYTKSIQ